MKRQAELVGVIHLPALPGSPKSALTLKEIEKRAIAEARMLDAAGFDAVILENFGDTPFFATKVPPITVAAMTRIASAVREATKLPLGINVLRNDFESALSIALVTECQFIRINVLSGVAATDQGLIEGQAASWMRWREGIGAGKIQVWGDALVKHARPLSLHEDALELAIEELAGRAMADAVIVTGATTGRPINPIQLAGLDRKSLRVPLYLGSGITAANAPVYAPLADGVIVGSALRKQGRAGAPLDSSLARKFVRAWKAVKEA